MRDWKYIWFVWAVFAGSASLFFIAGFLVGVVRR